MSASSNSRTSTAQQKVQTPLQYKKIFLLGMILIANNTSMWMIFSFLPSMVKFYYPMIPEHELGYKSGMLGAAYSAGGLLGNVVWGAASDRYGRRPALLGGLLGTAISAICFGFSPTYSIAVLSRFIWGILNGNIGVTKTYLGEISDDTNSARGMSLYGVIGGSGRIFGPLLGGLLYDPARIYPAAFSSSPFEHFPFALPALFVSVYCLCMFPFVAALLPETLVRPTRQEAEAERGSSVVSVATGVLVQLVRRSTWCPWPSKDASQHSHSPIPIYSASSAAPLFASSFFSGRALASFLCCCACSAASAYSAPPSRSSPSASPSAAASPAGSTGVAGDQRLPSSPSKLSQWYQPLSTEEPLSPQAARGQGQGLQFCDDAAEEIDEQDSYSCSEDASTGGLEMGLLLRHPASPDAGPLLPADEDRSHSGFCSGGLAKRKRRVCFLNQVTVKIIDEPGLMRSPLKQIRKDDVPLPWTTTSSSSSSWGAMGSRCGAKAAADVQTGPRRPGQGQEQEQQQQEDEEEEDQQGTAAAELCLYSNGSELAVDSAAPPASLGSRLKQVLRRREIFVSVLLYGLGALCVTLTAEVFPLWVVTAESDGGLGYGPEHIGLATALCGGGSVAVQLLLYPRLAESLGVLRMFRLGTGLFAAASLLLPSSVFMADYLVSAAAFVWSGAGGSDSDSGVEGEWTARGLALVLQLLSVCSSNWILISVFVLINNSCYSHQRATVNGIGQTFASLGRLLGPLLGAPLFAWSEDNGLSWPLNFCLTWYLICALCLTTAQMSSFLPRSIERQKREPRPSMDVAALDAVSAAAAASGSTGNSRGAGQGAGIGAGAGAGAAWMAAKNSDDENEPPSPPHLKLSASPVALTESDGGQGGGSGQVSPILRNLRRPKASPFAEPEGFQSRISTT